MVVTIVILSVVLAISLYLNWNLDKKIHILEKYCSNFLGDLTNLQAKISAAYHVIKQADIRGSFEADDEVGSVFNILKNCIETLNNDANGNPNSAKEESKSK